MLAGKKLLILGGDMLSADLIHTAKSMGVYTIVTDWYDTERSPGKLIADKYYNISTHDISELSNLIKEECIDGVLTGFTDSTLTPYVELCDSLNLPCYINKKQVEITTDKNLFKSYCSKYNIPLIKEYNLEQPIDESLLKDIEFPVIVKPVDNSGARGIRICNNAQELRDNYEYALSFSQSKEVLVEQYVIGKEATAFYLAINGQYYLVAMGDRHTKVLHEGHIPLPVGYTFPSKYLNNFKEDLEPKFKSMFSDLDIQNGLIFIQSLITDNGKILPYEMGYRLTGSLEYKVTDHLYGINAAKMLIRYALTENMVDNERLSAIDIPNNKKAANITFHTDSGRIDKILGVDKIQSNPNVVDCKLFYNEGSEISSTKIGTLLQVVARVLLVADSSDELIATISDVVNSFDVISSDGNSLLLDTLNINQLGGQEQ